MTIYILHHDPKMTPQYLDNKSLDKMIGDIAQVLCNVHINLIDTGYWATDADDIWDLKKKVFGMESVKEWRKSIIKWSRWSSEYLSNYLFMVALGLECSYEYFNRFTDFQTENYVSKDHKMLSVIEWARDNVPDLPLFKNNTYLCNTPIPLFIPKKYQLGLVYKDNSVTIRSYRNYYQDKLKTRIEAYNEWLDDVSCIGLEGCGSVSVETFESANWTNRRKPEWLNI